MQEELIELADETHEKQHITQTLINKIQQSDDAEFTHLNLNSPPYDLLDEENIIQVCHALAGNTTLTYLSINDARESKSQLVLTKALGEALNILFTRHKTLKEFLLKNTFSGTPEIKKSFMISFWKGLAENNTLTGLDLADTELDDEEAVYIADMLRTNKTLIKLDISDNKITNIGAKILAQALAQNTALKVFDLAVSEIKNNGIFFILDSLLNNTTLTSLVFYGTRDVHEIGVDHNLESVFKPSIS